ncbi:MAG: hypothetical protein HRU14_11645 [Planctomycetes bacterium]|nr:hypothetical protein [Planctomycetota bacterium]
MGFLLLVFLGGACVIMLRLWWVQFLAAEDIQRRALISRAVHIELPAVRGAIMAADGRVLARDRASFRVQVIPSTFRERALLHALVDLEVLLGSGPGQRQGRDVDGGRRDLYELREDARSAPRSFVRRVLGLPASRTRSVRMTDVGRVLCEEAGGDLIRAPSEMMYRLRQCLGVVQGRGLAFRRMDLSRIRAREGSVGDALETSIEEVARRLESELRVIEEVGESIGHETPYDTWTALDDLVRREIRWVNRYRDAEAVALLSLAKFGSPVLEPGKVPASEYLEVARALDLAFADGPRSRDVAWRSLQAADALLGGRLPDPSLGAFDAVDESPGSRSTENALERADAAGLRDMDPERVRREWYRRKRDGGDAGAILSSRQARDIRNRHRGGRAFVLGVGASAKVAARVIGPGRLQGIGFRLVPGFVRDEAVHRDLPAFVQQMIGQVTRRGRKGRFGAEASLDRRLAGEPGVASVDRDGGMTLKKSPADGKDITLSFSVDVLNRLQKNVIPPGVPPDTPFGLAVVDVRTGAVVGLASGPTPLDADALREVRSDAEEERRAIAFARAMVQKMERGEILQHLAFLAERKDPTRRERTRKFVLDRVARFGPDWLVERSRELNVADAESAAWHRGYELPGHCPPGSVFKALTILLGLSEGEIDETTTFDCGPETKTRQLHTCKGHGRALGVARALEKSCNEFCYQVGRRVGTERLLAFYERLGFFDPVPGLPVQPAHREPLVGADPQNLAIGGASLHCVPVRAAGLAASIARGRVVRPWVAPLNRPSVDEEVISLGSEPMLRLVREGMQRVCGPGGTARRHADELQRLGVAAKTGTADHTGPGGFEVHEAWFVGFAPADDPRLAFAVVLPNARADQRDLKGVVGADGAPYAVRALEICADAMGIRWW